MLKTLNEMTNGNAIPVIAAIAVVLLIHIFITIMMTRTVRQKGHNELGYFFLCLLFGIPGLIVTAALPDNRVVWALEDIYGKIGAQYSDGESTGIVAKKNDNAAPEGTTAYMPHKRHNKSAAQNEAVSKLQKYWSEYEPKTEIKEKKHKKSKRKEKKSVEKDNGIDIEINTKKTNAPSDMTTDVNVGFSEDSLPKND